MSLDATEPPRTDEALMAELRTGNDAALGELMQRWELPVKAFLLRLGVPAPEVEDVAQETFTRLYLTRDRFRTDAKLRPWLLTLAGNLGRNRIRTLSRRRESAFEDTDPPAPDTRASRATAERVREAVERLPADLRQTLAVVAFEELSQDEAADVLGCTRKAIEGRMRKARDLLRGWLERG
jgi:RNA polymerase sigma-70 factor, ECF subfamily